MYIYGTCSKCSHAKKMELRKLARNNSEKTDNKQVKYES